MQRLNKTKENIISILQCDKICNKWTQKSTKCPNYTHQMCKFQFKKLFSSCQWSKRTTCWGYCVYEYSQNMVHLNTKCKNSTYLHLANYWTYILKCTGPAGHGFIQGFKYLRLIFKVEIPVGWCYITCLQRIMVIFLLGLKLGWNYVAAQNLFLKQKYYITTSTMCHHETTNNVSLKIHIYNLRRIYGM